MRPGAYHPIPYDNLPASLPAVRCGKKHVVFSFEHTGHYHEPVAALLRERDCTILPLNPVTTKKERESELDRSKTDELDIHYITAAVAAGKVVTDRPLRPNEEELRFIARQRRSLSWAKRDYVNSPAGNAWRSGCAGLG